MNHFFNTLLVILIALGFIILMFIAYKVFVIGEKVDSLHKTVITWDGKFVPN